MENGEIQNVTVNFNADGDFVISEFLSGYRNEHFPLETSSEIISRHGDNLYLVNEEPVLKGEDANLYINRNYKISSKIISNKNASCTESDEQIVKYEDANMDTNADDTVLANEYSSLEVCNEITLDHGDDCSTGNMMAGQITKNDALLHNINVKIRENNDCSSDNIFFWKPRCLESSIDNSKNYERKLITNIFENKRNNINTLSVLKQNGTFNEKLLDVTNNICSVGFRGKITKSSGDECNFSVNFLPAKISHCDTRDERASKEISNFFKIYRLMCIVQKFTDVGSGLQIRNKESNRRIVLIDKTNELLFNECSLYNRKSLNIVNGSTRTTMVVQKKNSNPVDTVDNYDSQIPTAVDKPVITTGVQISNKLLYFLENALLKCDNNAVINHCRVGELNMTNVNVVSPLLPANVRNGTTRNSGVEVTLQINGAFLELFSHREDKSFNIAEECTRAMAPPVKQNRYLVNKVVNTIVQVKTSVTNITFEVADGPADISSVITDIAVDDEDDDVHIKNLHFAEIGNVVNINNKRELNITCDEKSQLDTKFLKTNYGIQLNDVKMSAATTCCVEPNVTTISENENRNTLAVSKNMQTVDEDAVPAEEITTTISNFQNTKQMATLECNNRSINRIETQSTKKRANKLMSARRVGLSRTITKSLHRR